MHIPVLQKEVIKYLAPEANKNFIDCTFGQGGHSFAILKKILPKGKVLAIDWDLEIIHQFERKKKNQKLRRNLILVCENFANLQRIVERMEFRPIHGVLIDLGVSSWHLEESGRGFSFQKNEPLIMRYDLNTKTGKKEKKLTAKKIINQWPEEKIAKILKEYGEEKFAKKIAKEIVKVRKKQPIKTTFQLVEIVKRATPFHYRRRRIHFATKTFQAFRIAVNEELENLRKVLPQALGVLAKKGRLVVISFHSLEDRIVKDFFKKEAFRSSIKILTKKPVLPQKSEVINNPRSRSAKLRACEKI